MKKDECSYTRRMLPRYLSGHLFRPQMRRIGLHLAACPFCRSEHDALRHVVETREILREVLPAEGASGRALRRASWLSALTRLFYRPLLLLTVLASAGAVFLYIILPLLYDPDLERLDSGTHAPPAAAPSPPLATEPSPTLPAPAAPPPADLPAPVERLVVTLTIPREEEQAAVSRLNEALQGHPLLNSQRFSEKEREISGSMTADELSVLFDRIRGEGKLSYKRARLKAAGAGERLFFVMRLRTAAKQPAPPQPAEAPAAAQPEKTANPVGERAGEGPADAAPAQQ
jgi:hypothetical protein